MTKSPTPSVRKGGRPSQARAAQIQDEILDIATRLFLTQGYGATSIEAIAQEAGMAKRTFYARFANKSELFAAVVHRLITSLRPKQTESLFIGTGSLEEMLVRIATVLLRASIAPTGLAMHRLMVSEAARFPELVTILHTEGARQDAIDRIAGLLQARTHTADFTYEKASFAAEQFMQLVVAAPQRRALGLGTPLTADELAAWVQSAVRLFLQGYAA